MTRAARGGCGDAALVARFKKRGLPLIKLRGDRWCQGELHVAGVGTTGQGPQTLGHDGRTPRMDILLSMLVHGTQNRKGLEKCNCLDLRRRPARRPLDQHGVRDAGNRTRVHDIRRRVIAGHLRDMMELYGPLYRHQNEGQERFNDRLTGRKKRHSQIGGACNRGAELCASRGATVGKCDSTGTWAGRSLCTADCIREPRP